VKNREYYDITAIVHCADILVRALDFGNSGDTRIPVMSEQVWKSLKLNSKNLPALLKDISDEFEKAKIMIEL
jgi:hypothetical protein